MTRCRNCETPLEANFCPQCGQRNIDLERPLTELIGEVLRETFEVDGRTFRTVWTLFRRPGVLTSEFLAGHRKRYTPPFRLYLVISILFFLLATWLAGQGVLLSEGQNLQADAPLQARFIADDLPRLMFVLLPVFALLLKAAFRKRFYFDHLIYSLHLHSAAYVVMALMLPLERASGERWFFLVAQLALFGYMLGYFTVSLRRVYRAGWLAVGLKSTAVLMGYLTVFGVLVEVASNYVLPLLSD